MDLLKRFLPVSRRSGDRRTPSENLPGSFLYFPGKEFDDPSGSRGTALRWDGRLWENGKYDTPAGGRENSLR